MELKPFDNIIHFFVMYPGHLNYKNMIKTHSHKINSLYTDCWKQFFKQKCTFCETNANRGKTTLDNVPAKLFISCNQSIWIMNIIQTHSHQFNFLCAGC